MVVGDDEIDAERGGKGGLLHAGDAAVHGDDERDALLGKRADRIAAEAVALLNAAGNVHEHRRAAVLEGQRRHFVIHLQENVVVKARNGRHALSERDIAPHFALGRHEGAVTEEAPFSLVDFIEVELRRFVIELPEAAAFASGFKRRRIALFPAAGTYIIH